MVARILIASLFTVQSMANSTPVENTGTAQTYAAPSGPALDTGTSAAGNASGLAAAATPFTPDEVVPMGLEEVPPQLEAEINALAAIPARATAGMADYHIPEIAPLQAGLKLYTANRQSCINDQARAATFCREETSPNLQKTLMAVNGVAAVANAAMNDACSKFSKAMTIAQAGMTAYTGICGVLQKKCNLSCTAAGNGLKQIRDAAFTSKSFCKPWPGPQAAKGGQTCSDLTPEVQQHRNKIMQLFMKEASISDKRSIHAKSNLCQKTYGFLLLTAGASLISMANSLKQGQKCDEESKAHASGGNGSGASAVVPADTSDSVVVSNEVAGSGSSSADSPPAIPVVPDLPTETKPAPDSTTQNTVAGESTSGGDRLDTGGGVRMKGQEFPGSYKYDNTSREVASTPSADSSYRQYLPGGAKAMAGTSSTTTNPHPDITSAGGKTNFEKMRQRYIELGLDSP